MRGKHRIDLHFRAGAIEFHGLIRWGREMPAVRGRVSTGRRRSDWIRDMCCMIPNITPAHGRRGRKLNDRLRAMALLR